MKVKASCLRGRHCAAFTLVDLLAVAAAVLILAATVLPALASPRRANKAVVCMNNLKELMQAAEEYATDRDGLLPPNPDDSNIVPGHNWTRGRPNSPQPADDLSFMDGQLNPFAVYLDGGPELFKCPAAPETVMIGGSPHTVLRTYSMNHAVGTICASYPIGHQGEPSVPVHGPWLNNLHSHRRDGEWRTFGKISSFVNPAGTFVFGGEDWRSINDGNFAMGLNWAEWIDWPAAYHDFGGAFVFADGHAELRRWVEASTRVPPSGPARRVVEGSRDHQWLAERTSSRIESRE